MSEQSFISIALTLTFLHKKRPLLGCNLERIAKTWPCFSTNFVNPTAYVKKKLGPKRRGESRLESGAKILISELKESKLDAFGMEEFRGKSV